MVLHDFCENFGVLWVSLRAHYWGKGGNSRQRLGEER